MESILGLLFILILLAGIILLQIFLSKRENKWVTVYEGVARGRVIGGNLNTMQ